MISRFVDFSFDESNNAFDQVFFLPTDAGKEDEQQDGVEDQRPDNVVEVNVILYSEYT